MHLAWQPVALAILAMQGRGRVEWHVDRGVRRVVAGERCVVALSFSDVLQFSATADERQAARQAALAGAFSIFHSFAGA